MKKYDVTVTFTIQAEDRKGAWLEGAKVCERHLRDLAHIDKVHELTLEDMEFNIAVNEPIRAQG